MNYEPKHKVLFKWPHVVLLSTKSSVLSTAVSKVKNEQSSHVACWRICRELNQTRVAPIKHVWSDTYWVHICASISVTADAHCSCTRWVFPCSHTTACLMVLRYNPEDFNHICPCLDYIYGVGFVELTEDICYFINFIFSLLLFQLMSIIGVQTWFLGPGGPAGRIHPQMRWIQLSHSWRATWGIKLPEHDINQWNKMSSM